MYRKIYKDIIIILLLMMITLALLFPIYILILVAFKSTNSVVLKEYNLYFNEFEFSNFVFLKDKSFWNALLISFASALLLILIRLAFYSSFIIGINKLGERVQKLMLLIILIFSFMPEFSIYLSLRELLGKMKLLNSLTPLSLVTNSLFSYFFIYNLLLSYKKTEQKYDKLIKNDNLKWWERFYFVYWKELKNMYFLLIIFSFISIWNDYLWPNFLLSNTEYKTVGIWFRQIGATPSGGHFINIQAAGSLIALVVPVGLYFAFSSKIVSAK
ncbi:ABC transporter permease subunit [Mycoplasmopsis edwardii]|uniref:ABC transporter permease subunit n=1 Tax=Mycoplasmopsis edwardii TaxID=53558 RepID=A0ACD4PK89_9BACT|nr:ABC transporter permease subunit [Mycoplasmopsis edwardii]WBP84281.1 ABC transporter permease subunit [Mycoplasmopsis edwardii]